MSLQICLLTTARRDYSRYFTNEEIISCAIESKHLNLRNREPLDFFIIIDHTKRRKYRWHSNIGDGINAN